MDQIEHSPITHVAHQEIGERPDTVDIPEEVNPDELRPVKRVKLDGGLSVTDDTQNEMGDADDWDDLYGTSNPATPTKTTEDTSFTNHSIPATNGAAPASDGGLPTAIARTQSQEHQFGVTVAESEDLAAKTQQEVEPGVPADAIDNGDDLVAPPPHAPPESGDRASIFVMEDTTQIECQPIHPATEQDQANGDTQTSHPATEQDQANGDTQTPHPLLDPLAGLLSRDDGLPQPKVTEDAEFMAAAAVQKGNQDAEWNFDPSDAESSSDLDSSDSDDSSDDSDSGSEGGYEMLDPATAAKILMSGDGDDDGGTGKDKSGADHQPRTANETKEEVVPKPDVQVTEDMNITYLGTVDRTVENMVLIKGATSGDYQVLESGSVLCNEKREVVGAVADTFGKVQEPLYSVAFTNAQGVQEAGLEFGTRIYYVDTHSTFVFTQPLRTAKGTDASNIHDEEIGEDELEFSDDEEEAAFKSQRKRAKKEGRTALTRSEFQAGARSFVASGHDGGHTYTGNSSDVPAQSYGGALSYDDEPTGEDFYQPLKRPENLAQLMSNGAPPPRQQPSTDRGRGRGRGDGADRGGRGRGRGGDRGGRGDRARGRGDRGRGRGGLDRDQRGGRGGQRGQHQQNHQDRPSSYSIDNPRSSLPPRPNFPQVPPPQVAPPIHYQPPAPQTYQFGGQSYQYGAPQPPPVQAPQYNHYAHQQPAGPQPGAYVNPAFYQQQPPQQQQASQLTPQQQQAYAAWFAQQHAQQQAQQQYAQAPQAAVGAQPPQRQQQPQEPAGPQFDLSGILKRLSGQQ